MPQVSQLAYVVAESTDIPRWRAYAEQVLGMQALDDGDGLALKMDERDFRISVVAGDEDRYFASGWEVADAAAFEETIAVIEAAGQPVERGDAALKQARRVSDIATFRDPAGNRHELGHGYTGGSEAFVSPIGVPAFKTGKYGMGHTVLPALPFDETRAFFVERLGFGVSDEFNFQPPDGSPGMRIHFLHCINGRHHSLALAEMPNPAGCVHIMVEVESMTEVGRAHDRMQAFDVKLMATLGQHTNDKMTSFYMMTPSNFALEFGWGGEIVDPSRHETTHTESVSIWGHDFSVGFQ
ncbi:VOC family protein [Algiphilus sp.]|uniref:VOC family protein n=1 Tax=Algiphilus sp. TaxID=1872431 RepID=UPI0025C568E3|nr:VOC family protein [Algiphilus sp.]MCK5769684.1 VOC family protein [Algiphilus sp.]